MVNVIISVLGHRTGDCCCIRQMSKCTVVVSIFINDYRILKLKSCDDRKCISKIDGFSESTISTVNYDVINAECMSIFAKI
jgi:hypothetical protein